MKVLLTGSTGFVGSAVARDMIRCNMKVIAAVRKLPVHSKLKLNDICYKEVGDIDKETEWSDALIGVETVVHCAGHTYVTKKDLNTQQICNKINVEGTFQLAKQAAEQKVKRFVYISSIKVNGEHTLPGQIIDETSTPNPQDFYAKSKFEAEKLLLNISTYTNMEIVIIRPPIIYGPGVKGNFAKILNLLKTGIPLPLGKTNNLRSLIGIENFVSVVLLCAERKRSPNAANQVFMVSDGEDISTTTLLRKISKAAGILSLLIPIPNYFIIAGASFLGKSTTTRRLLNNLQIDITKINNLLGWSPEISIDEQLLRMFEKENNCKFYSYINEILFRFFDIMFAGIGLFVLLPILIILYILGLFDTGSPLFKQERVGRYEKSFILVKFRSMHLDTSSAASHLISSKSVTNFGKILRFTKLDELPQLWNVLNGEMSLVGPRPGLFNQHELTKVRKKYNVFIVRPGITGLAQINGIDMSTPKLLAKTDAKMLKELNIINYFKLIILTIIGKGKRDSVRK